MSKIKEPFEQLLSAREQRLRKCSQVIEEHQVTIKKWHRPRENLRSIALGQFNRWLKSLKKLKDPIPQIKIFRRERKKLRRSNRLRRFRPRVLRTRISMLLMWLLRILRLPFLIVLYPLSLLFKKK